MIRWCRQGQPAEGSVRVIPFTYCDYSCCVQSDGMMSAGARSHRISSSTHTSDYHDHHYYPSDPRPRRHG